MPVRSRRGPVVRRHDRRRVFPRNGSAPGALELEDSKNRQLGTPMRPRLKGVSGGGVTPSFARRVRVNKVRILPPPLSSSLLSTAVPPSAPREPRAHAPPRDAARRRPVIRGAFFFLNESSPGWTRVATRAQLRSPRLIAESICTRACVRRVPPGNPKHAESTRQSASLLVLLSFFSFPPRPRRIYSSSSQGLATHTMRFCPMLSRFFTHQTASCVHDGDALTRAREIHTTTPF